jgi:hypothetical protein
MIRRHGPFAAALLLAGSILVRYDTMEIVMYVPPGTRIEAPAEFAAREACPVLRSMQLALPTPYRIQWDRELPTGGAVPDETKVVTGMLTSCERA